ncbi:MAG TPA: tetratricopeptide repeat protein, partial [Micromonosporaceae bacterium]|nr:tetratricopeptide repeat protein [Micromonosporaceae bacterium]
MTVIAVITGPPGVGKTALAVQWAHRVRRRFTDGDLYVNLRGYDIDPPVSPDEALDGFLRALSVPVERIPPTVDGKAALYRTQIQRRRILLILDNASTAEQVRPLLPDSTGCVVVVTSRSRLPSLTARNGARQISLDPLSTAEATSLLREIIGAARVDAEPGAALDLARHCGYLPLALRIAADRAAARPHVRLAYVSGELACEQDRLDLLATMDNDETTAMRAVFAWSFRELHGEAARTFRLLGLHAGPDISVAAAAALAGTTAARVRPLLEALNSVHLLERAGENRYRLHDLLRAYAAERAIADENDHDRASAVARVLAWYLYTATVAGRVLDCGPTFDCQPRQALLGSADTDNAPPTFTTHEQALAWFKTDCANLVAAVGQAFDAGQYEIAWKLPFALSHFFDVDKPSADWISVHRIGLAAVRHLNNQRGEACILADLAGVYQHFQQFDESLDCRLRSLVIFREIGDQWGEALSLCYLGRTHHRLGELDHAVGHLQRSLDIWQALGNRSGQALALNILGGILRALQRHDEALAHHQKALAIYRETGNARGEGDILYYLGLTYAALQRQREAIDCLHQAVAIFRGINSRRLRFRYNDAEALCLLGVKGHLKVTVGGHRMSPPVAMSGHDRLLVVRVRASRMRNDSPSVTTT